MPGTHLQKPFWVNKFVWLLGFVLLINIVQACCSALLNDEPYYWIYARYLSWGYFDHPPLIALLIKAGSSVFGGEIGVRLLPLIFGSGTFYLICKIIDDEVDGPVNFKLLAMLLLSSLFLNLYSFLAIPDTPLLFFGALFLYAYRRYLNEDNVATVALLGVVVALLLYAKYHGILIVAATLISNLRILRRQSFVLIVMIALVLYMPHIYWEMQHDYPTLRFQFIGRSGEWGTQHLFSYIGEQAAVTGPVILLLFSILYKPANQFQKTLKYNVVGVFAFFLLSSLKAMVNVHWTAIAWPPMLCLSYLYIDKLKDNLVAVYGLLVINLVAVVVLRLNFGFNWFNISNFNDKNPKLMATTLAAQADSRPLVFDNSYNEPSYYTFYTGNECFAVNDIWYKKTQYNYLPGLEQKFQDKSVAYISDGMIDSSSRQISIPQGKRYYLTLVDHFTSFIGVNLNILNPVSNLKATQPGAINVSVDVAAQDIPRLLSSNAFILLTFTNNRTQERIYHRYPLPAKIINGATYKLAFKAPAQQGDYQYQLSVVAKQHVGVGFNSNLYKATVN